MKNKALFWIFVILAFFVGFAVRGIGDKNDKPVDAVSPASESVTTEQTLASVNKVLEPFLKDYEQRYEILDTERAQLQSELDATKQELAAINSSGDMVSTLKSQVSQQQSEIGSLNAALQNAINDSASWQRKFLQSLSTIDEIQKSLSASQSEYSILRSKLSVVNNNTSDTVNGFTADERTTFYEIWDAWWDLVIIGAN